MPYTPPPNYTPTIEEIFTYVDPNTFSFEEQQKHTEIDTVAKSFAFVIDKNVSNVEYKKQILLLLQQTSLLSHQGLRIDYVNSNGSK